MTNSDLSVQRPQPRVIRVFISSTFHDMQAERDELVKFAFPRLRKMCEPRGVTWGEVDLRWGITKEQSAEGQVLPICLEEIRRCRPYFIGLLGERYGWIPNKIPAELVEREPWLAQHRDHSVTELEILHGVLNDPGMADRALFYFRNPTYVDSLPTEERSRYREEATSEEIERYGPAEAQRRADERRRKLEALKGRIRASGMTVRVDYADPQALGELVLQDLTAVIDEIYPEGSQPDPLDREAAEHEAFARSRARIYIGGERYFERLDAHAAGDGPPLVILGESGSGKSALLANWAMRYRERPAETPPPEKRSFWSWLIRKPQAAAPARPTLILLHFVGGTPYSADWAAMLRRVMGEFQRRLGIKGDIPDQPDALRAAFANWLHMAATRGRVVLILDGLNQLEDRDQAPDLAWLPPEIPANVRLILSTLPGRPLDELKRRGWPALEVQPLAYEERKRLIVEYLAQYTKALSAARAERLAAAPQSANPLYLRVLLEELRLFGVHERLDERINHYLAAVTVEQLFERVLARYEADYERDRPGLVAEVMSLLWAARRGLSEPELLDLLGQNGQPLPRAAWSPLYLAAETSFVNCSGLLGFFHDYLRRAVAGRYLATEGSRASSHLRLANYCGSRELGPRRVDEEPWQLAQAGAWERLYSLLGDLSFFDAAWQANQYEVKTNWAQLEGASKLRMVAAYRQVLAAPDIHNPDTAWRLGLLLADTGHPVEALTLQEHLVQRYRNTGDRAGLAGALGNQAAILRDRGDLDRAMALLEEQERLCREPGHIGGLQASLVNRAVILQDRGELDRAVALQQTAERLYRKLGDKEGLQASLGNQALISKDRGDLDRAMALLKEQERLCREVGDKAGQARSLVNQAAILQDRGDLDRALALLKEQERLCRELGYKAGLQGALGNQALILYARGELAPAMALQQEAEGLCRELGDKAGLQRTLVNQALILQDRGDLDRAMALHREAERLCRYLGDKAGLARSLGNQAVILKDRGDLDRAMALHREEERLFRELSNKAGLQVSLGNQAVILQNYGYLDRAIELHREEERLCRELGDKQGLAYSLINQASALGLAMNQPRKALPLADEAFRLAREAGYAPLVRQIEAIRANIRTRLEPGDR